LTPFEAANVIAICLALDDTKIKEDLVFDKHSCEMIGVQASSPPM